MLVVFGLLLFVILIIRPITVIIHELGYALPAIILTRRKVTIFIGSYGNPKNSFKLNIGLLEAWFIYNPLKWQRGLCVPDMEDIALNKMLIYTITGPISSFFIAILSCYVTFTFNLHGSLKLFFSLMLLSSIFDLFSNLSPSSKPVNLYLGKVTYNDGYQIKYLLQLKRHSPILEKIDNLLKLEKFNEASEAIDTFTDKIKNGFVLRHAMLINLKSERYNRVIEIYNEILNSEILNADDYSWAALAFSKLEDYNKGIELYDKSLELDPNHKFSLNNKGYALNSMERYEEAIKYFDKLIVIDSTWIHAYSNRGFAKIKLGLIECGLKDVHHSLTLDPNHAYAYRTMGIYYIDKQEYNFALEQFLKAKELDNSTDKIDELINNARLMIV